MPLIIEDGTGIAGANSYASVAEARAYAALRGLTLSVVDADVEKALVLACDKLETYKYKGNKTSEDNVLAWPRQYVRLGAAVEDLPDDSIPDRLKQAQCQFAYDSTLTDLLPTGTGREVISTKVDVLEVHYAQKNSGVILPEFTKAEAFLAPLLLTGGGISLTTVRI